jgi:parallel beta-helix repeat protein
MRTLIVALAFLFCSQCFATSPLTLAEFRDCVGANIGAYDTDCVLDSGTYVICDPSDMSCSPDYQGQITVTRPIITIEGAWPYPTLQRKSSPWFRNSLIGTTSGSGSCPYTSSLGNPCFVFIEHITFDGNYYSGTGQPCCSVELDFDSCAYCQVYYSEFLNSPDQSLYMHYDAPSALGYDTFDYSYHSGVYSNSGGPAVGCGGAPYWFPHVCQNVIESTFSHEGASAIALNSSSAQIVYNTMSGNVILCADNAGAGQVYIDSTSDSILIYGNTANSAGHCANGYAGGGLELHGTNLTITDNIIQNNSNEGIYMEGVQNVTISTDDPSTYVIQSNNQNPQSSSCGTGFLYPGIHVHTVSSLFARATQYVTLNNISSIGTYPANGPQTYGVTVDSCDVGMYHGPAVTHLTITNSCLAGNAHGAYADKNNCGSGGTSACIDSSTSSISGNSISGCGGY